MLAGMELGTRSLVGRARELTAITSALAAAQGGRGSVWLISGEPGIGKSRFVEEVARVCAEHELNVLWGRAWEAGGAPAYWLFIQVLRALLRIEDPRALLDAQAGATLVELLPELPDVLGREPERASSPIGLEPNQAHFRVMDAATRVLCAAAQRSPMLIILEDLHAADPASIAVLGLLAQQARDTRLVIIGTYRESEAQRGPCADALARVARGAERISLDRLSADEARELLARASGAALSDDLCAAVYAASEGNPLFVGELARLHAQQRLAPRAVPGEPTALALPASIKSAIRSRLASLAPRARHVLGMAAVVGREHRIEALERLAQRSRSELLEILDECLAAEIVLEVAPGLLRFSHILLREVAYADLEPVQREAAHAAYAALLADNAERSASEHAHHLLLAGPDDCRPAYEASRRAGRHAFQQHAYVEAASWYARALDALSRVEHGPAERCALLIDLGEAQLNAHDFTGGEAACLEAGKLARELGDAELFTRAALTLGAVFRIAEVSPPLVAALQEALAMLSTSEQLLRAKVMARLAAAMQPASEVSQPIAMAWEAIEIARRLGDAQTLLEVIRAGCSAIIDLGPPLGCVELCREHIALAERLGNQAEAFRGNVRLSICAYSAGLIHEALAAVDACERIARALAQPHFGWRATALAAMRATWLGRFDEAHALQSTARQLAGQAADPRAYASLHMQRVGLLALQGAFDEALLEFYELERHAPQSPMVQASCGIWGASLCLRAGRAREAFERIQRFLGFAQAAMDDATLLGAIVEVAIASDDRPLMAQLRERIAARQGENVSGGVFGMTWDMPVRRSAADLAAAFGEWDLAKSEYDTLFRELRELGARPHLAWALYEHGRMCCERGETERGQPLLLQARALAEQIGIRTDAFAYRPASASQAAPEIRPGAPTQPPELRLVREGEYWAIERAGRAFRLKDGKGIAMLARLIEQPGRELHVLDLAGAASGEAGAVDGGDAGTLLDARARASYQARVRELREELQDAERNADTGRAARATEELDALTSELARAVGLGGRDRRAASAVERARVNVQRRLRDALERIREHDPDLGRHLAFTVKTGTYCSYLR